MNDAEHGEADIAASEQSLDYDRGEAVPYTLRPLDGEAPGSEAQVSAELTLEARCADAFTAVRPSVGA